MTQYTAVIPTLNEEHYVGALLDDLVTQTHQPAQIIVVDAGSRDATHRVVSQFSQATWVPSMPPVGAQRDVGGRLAESEWIVFLDADTRLESNTFEQLFAHAAERKLDVFCPRYEPHQSTWYIRAWHALLNAVMWAGQKHFPSGAGPCIAVRRTLFLEVGGIHSQYLCDDAEFVRRAAMHGRFAMMPISVWISDRRYRKYGFFPTVWQYLRMGWWFTRGDFAACNRLEYRFGEHDPKLTEKSSKQ